MSDPQVAVSALRSARTRTAENINHALNSAYFLWALFLCVVVAVAIWNRIHRYRRYREPTGAQRRPRPCIRWLSWTSTPILGSRHSKALSIAGLDIANVPTGLQALIGIIYVVAMIVGVSLRYRIMDDDPLYDNNKRVQLCKYIALRTGILAFANLPLVIGLAGRNNFLILLTGISKDTWITLHRLAGRMVVVLSVVHTICYLVLFRFEHSELSYLAIIHASYVHAYFRAGIAAMVAAFFLFVHSAKSLRVLWYECFIFLHISAVVVLLVGSLLHAKYAQSGFRVAVWVYLGIGLFMLDYAIRMCLIVHTNVSLISRRLASSAKLSTLPGGITQIDIQTTRRSGLKEGQTVYLTFPKLGIFQSHPFTLMSIRPRPDPMLVDSRERQSSNTSLVSTTSTYVDSASDGPFDDHVTGEKKPYNFSHPTPRPRNFDAESTTSIPLSDTTNTNSDTCRLRFMVKARSGMTRNLLEHAAKCSDTLAVLVQPVLQPRLLDQKLYDSLIIVAGGVGITAALSELKAACTTMSSSATRRMAAVTLFWIVRHADQAESLIDELDEIASNAPADCRVVIKVFVTRDPAPKSGDLPESCSRCISIVHERPEITQLMSSAASEAIGKVAVVACGPGLLLDNIRMYLFSECKLSVNYHEQAL